jgi:hypothetical protein
VALGSKEEAAVSNHACLFVDWLMQQTLMMMIMRCQHRTLDPVEACLFAACLVTEMAYAGKAPLTLHVATIAS